MTTKNLITWQNSGGSRHGRIYAGTAHLGDGRSSYVVEPWVRFGHRVGWLATLGAGTHLGVWPTAREARETCEREAATHAARAAEVAS